MSATPELKSFGCLLNVRQVSEQTSLSVPTIYRWMKDGRFPKSLPLGGKRVAWTEADIEAWKQRAIKGALAPPS
ncbi:MAG: helix-turn-helix transcriptional regulator [Novosphingobium sp.]